MLSVFLYPRGKKSVVEGIFGNNNNKLNRSIVALKMRSQPGVHFLKDPQTFQVDLGHDNLHSSGSCKQRSF